MCGISAFITATSPDKQKTERQLHDSLDSIKHRGPDARGTYFSPDYRVGLGHVRLSIIDLSADGNQPFRDDSAGIYAVVNGEIYNHEDYRTALSTEYTFTSSSDCEIVIALYKRYGTSFVSHLRGEFALVLWDSRREMLFAARDRYGIKSLYYTVAEGKLLVATEMKAFLGFGLRPQWDVHSLKDNSGLFGRNTFLRGVKKVLPGHALVSRNSGAPMQNCYWDAEFPDKTSKETRTEEECIQGVRDRLMEAVKLRLRADVPVGVYLSGGVDSSAIAGMVAHLMKEQGAKLGNETSQELSRLKVFTVQFGKDGKNSELDIAKRTAKWLGVDIHPVIVEEEDLASRLEDAAWYSEAPFYDVIAMGKLAMAEKVHSQGIKVVITGEGSDEHLAGYQFLIDDAFAEPDYTWPGAARPMNGEEKALSDTGNLCLLGSDLSGPEAACRMVNNVKTSRVMAHANTVPLAPWIHSVPAAHPQLALAENMDGRVITSMMNKWHPLHTALYLSMKVGLGNIILRYMGDNIDMVHAVESRTPFLDHHFTEYVNGLPPSLKMKYDPVTKDIKEKYILKEAVKPFVTEEIYNRRKQMFLGPVEFEQNGPIHMTIARLATKENVDKLGFLNWEVVKAMIDKAFIRKDPFAFRGAMVVAQLVVLGQRFGIETASPLDYGLSRRSRL